MDFLDKVHLNLKATYSQNFFLLRSFTVMNKLQNTTSCNPSMLNPGTRSVMEKSGMDTGYSTNNKFLDPT
jgi:hypothetical protein